MCRVSLSRAAVIEDDLPAAPGLLRSFFKDEGEDAVRVSAGVGAPHEMEAAGNSCEVRVERVYFQIREGQLAHLLFVCINLPIALEDAGITMGDGFANEGGVG